jgi:DNA (cytosine-5)-methyltransferase 1
MARLGLGPRWNCDFANEWCEKKAAAYAARFGSGYPRVCKELRIGDIARLTAVDLPGKPDLAWASFPCQDLSLAGAGAGLGGQRSGTFRHFWKLVEDLADEGRAPGVVVLENVVGTITSHGGKDFAEILNRISGSGYSFGPMVVDALRFVPQSRPRLFVVAVRDGFTVPSALDSCVPTTFCHPISLLNAHAGLADSLRSHWIWWNLPTPMRRIKGLKRLIEDEPTGVTWHSAEQTRKLIDMMSPLNREKVRKAQVMGSRVVGTVYRRTRPDEDGEKIQRAEVRFDDISGCLRTPVGGSSRQIILVVEGNSIRSRLLSPREAARLMGVPEDYPIPPNYNEAYHLFGDGIAVPVVRHLEEHLLWPLAANRPATKAA